ncbi:hypothetical protein [Azospirillum sp. B506]|uniref:hypothetical protein n=1 Tax=Azospirillum sp. B506 TaxID=137721 RepID=UPI000344E517|nr:hypothetical protein [Azospirillum sp. B506]
MHLAIIVVVAVLSVGLRMAVPVQAIASTYDDLLFIRLADFLCRGEWLGPYDNLTLAKGAGYPAFICASSWLGLPLRLSEHLLYLLACGVSSLAVGTLSGRKWLSTATFMALALLPIFWGADLSRVIRENIYIPISLLVLSCAALAYAVDGPADHPRFHRPLSHRILALLGLGVSAAAYWLTREETPWLYPAVGLLLLHWGVLRCRAIRRTGTLLSRDGSVRLMLPLLIPTAVAGGIILTICTLNHSHYGVFRDNDFRQGPFVDAYGAISRITYRTPWKRYLAFPPDARQAAYSVSPAAAQLQPFLEGPKGAAYMAPGFGSYDTTGFMWVLRDAVADLGLYRDAGTADAFYRRLAGEIDAACDRGAIACLPARSTFMPPVQPNQLTDALVSAYDFFWKASGFRSGPVGARPSIGTEETVRHFAGVTHSLPTPLESGSAAADLRSVSGWAYSPHGPLSIGADQAPTALRIELGSGDDVLAAFGTAGASALRFRATGDSAAALSIRQDGTTVRLPLSAPPGPFAGTAGDLVITIDQSAAVPPPAETIGGSPANVAITGLYRAAGPWLVSISLIWLGLFTLWSVLRQRRIDGFLIFWLAVAAAFTTRIMLVSFLNAVALRSDYHYLYVSPAVPFGILVVACAVGSLWRLRPPQIGR